MEINDKTGKTTCTFCHQKKEVGQGIIVLPPSEGIPNRDAIIKKRKKCYGKLTLFFCKKCMQGKALCSACKEIKNVNDGAVLTLPSKDSPYYFDMQKKNIEKYGLEAPFICNNCSEKNFH